MLPAEIHATKEWVVPKAGQSSDGSRRQPLGHNFSGGSTWGARGAGCGPFSAGFQVFRVSLKKTSVGYVAPPHRSGGARGAGMFSGLVANATLALARDTVSHNMHYTYLRYTQIGTLSHHTITWSSQPVRHPSPAALESSSRHVGPKTGIGSWFVAG